MELTRLGKEAEERVGEVCTKDKVMSYSRAAETIRGK